MRSEHDVAGAVERCDVLVVGAGPTGLALAAGLRAWDLSVRLIDAALDRVHESRALGVQPRTLEVLRPFGVTDELVARGNPATRLRITAGGRVASTPLFDIGAEDTAFPFLLFVSQAETEAVLADHLSARGLPIERGVTFESFRHDGDDGLRCTVRRPDGAHETIRTRYLVGCDGAHSAVRQQAALPFLGGRYPQTFLLADLSADGLEDGAANAYLGPAGPVLFFPLGRPAPWRLITMRSPAPPSDDSRTATLEELQAASDRATGGAVRLRDPVWTSVFRIQHRAAPRYRTGRVLVAGDAAHVHSPAGAQGMNTGIQDAVNLAWKLALVCRGAPEGLLDSYDAERRPVGEFVLRFTDRAFAAATSDSPLTRAVRTHVVPRVLPWVFRFRAGRRWGFRTVSELGIRYRHSPVVAPDGSRRRPRAGDRLPDARVLRAGKEIWLQEAVSGPRFFLLLCGSPAAWSASALEDLRARHGPRLEIVLLTPEGAGGGDLADASAALARLRVRGNAHFVVRPDGHIGYRADDDLLAGAARYLDRWLPERRAFQPGHGTPTERWAAGR